MVRAAVLDFVAGANPRDHWHSTQHGMSSLSTALRLIARANLPLPAATDDMDPGWRAYIELVYELWRRDASLPADVEGAWGKLLDDQRELIADLLVHQHRTTWMSEKRDLAMQEALLQTLPAEGTEALVWSLEHPDSLRSCFTRSHADERSDHTMVMLGRIADQRAAEVMRRFVSDPRLGTTAVAAIREIEARVMP